ncbi:MAG: type I polyketide synthase [Symploca sp. SIO2C1]|nr:type I polyketide synthase [Symploca sp. SIO2C1]
MNLNQKPEQELSPLQKALLALKDARSKLEKYEAQSKEPIAIIGMGCRFPGGVDSPEAFWQLLSNGVDAISEVPSNRWNINDYYDPNPDTPGKIATRDGGFISLFDSFDAPFFGISPREVHSLDPQQRLLLEVSWEALENAYLVPDNLFNSLTGVFIGICATEYFDKLLSCEIPQAYWGTGNAHSAASGRLSYILGLKGPSLAVNTACSSSLVSVHLACQSLRQRECNLALAGGVNLLLTPAYSVVFSQAKMLSPDGRCKTFDASANGYVRGEGCGMIVLKRLSDAVANGDNILAVIRGTAVNQDGPSGGLTVPNGPSQVAVIRQALDNGGVDPGNVSYIEAHGTGTSLGDPIEVGAIGTVFNQTHSQNEPLIIGSAKTNIGHLEGSAGIAGLIKVVLQLQYQKIAPILHFNQPSPNINWSQLPVKVPTEVTPWETNAKSRIGGVSSFGFSGTNAHIVIEEAPTQEKKVTVGANGNSPVGNYPVQEEDLERSAHLLTLSAKTEAAVGDLVSSYQNYLKTYPELGLGDICYTANTSRTNFEHKLAAVASNQQELVEKLQQYQQGEEVTGIYSGELPNNSTVTKIALLFTGQGSQYVNMGRQLYEQAPIFREAINQCDAILSSVETFQDISLRDILYPADKDSSDLSLLDQTAYTQPALFVIEYALAKLWESWSIKPKVVMGHSVGEYVAATIAGVFSLEDGLKLIAARGRLMQQLPPGGEMVSLLASESQVTEAIANYSSQVAIAAINGPSSVVISGEREAIGAIVSQLEATGVKTKQLQVSHAFHSPLMEPMLAEFRAVAKQVTYQQPKIPMLSNVTGKQVGSEIATAEYWVNHVRQPVRFADSMKTLHQQGYELFLEIGPKPILLGMGRQCLPEAVGIWLPSLRPGVEAWQQMLSSLGQLYLQGAKVDWVAFDRDYLRQKVALPTYPFQRESYWLETENGHQPKLYVSRAKSEHPLLGEKLKLAGIEHQHRFQSYVSVQYPGYLVEHQVFDQVIFPATGYLEIAMAAGKSLWSSSGQVVVSDVVIMRGLMLPEAEVKAVQTVVNSIENNSYKFEIFSTSEGENQQPWLLHTQGNIYIEPTAKTETKVDLEKYQAECSQAIDIEQHYQKYRERGLNYGNSFQGIKQLWKGTGKALGQIVLPEALTTQVTDYQLHPALLDAALQIVAHALEQTETNVTYLPVGIGKWKLYRHQVSQVWAIAQIPQQLTADILLLDNQGIVIGEIEGLRLKQTTVSALLRSIQPDLGNWYYQIHWMAQALPSTNPSPTAKSKWLILSEDNLLVEALTDKGQECVLVSAGDRYQQLSEQHYQINPTNAEQFQQLLEENPGITQIVHLWSVSEVEGKDNLALEKITEKSCGVTLHLVQAIINSKPEKIPQLWLVTQGTQSVNSNSEVINPEYGSLWGLGRVIAQEHPELQCKRIDLETTHALDALVAELLSEDTEDQIALRQGSRYVARLVQKPHNNQITSPDQPVQLKVSEYGLIDNLNWQPMQRQTPSSDEVEIEVAAVGLNFRDVLNALGLLQEYYAEHLGITSAEQLTFGFECAGTVIAVGEGVSDWQVGDQVIATMLQDAFSSFLTVPADYVMAKPQQMSFNEAATLPLTFLTAYYGLQQLAKIQPGEKVLIHAAAGGVGQAAVQIAQLAGAEIFATASPGKWEFLKSLGIKHIMNSRTLDFAEEIIESTAGEGVDIILNSLNGEYIPKNLEILAEGGRFVEIGKIGIWSQEEVGEKRADVSYLPFDLGEVVQQQPAVMAQLKESLTQQWKQGELAALPHKVFSSTQITDAFRYMQQSKQIGKVVVEMPQLKTEQKSFQPEASYLITGGLGALGLEVAQWMVAQGAKNIVLTGRSAPKETAQKVITELEAAGVSVSVLLGDISHQEDVENIFQQIATSLPPLKGVIHAAGVLDDGVLQKMSWQQFTKVMAPKVQGTWYLHQFTKDLPLDWFVCFSSIASMLGNLGQGNYAAANAFMDSVAHYRRGMGLPGLSINWGAWAAAGMAASLDAQYQQRLDAMGMSAIEPEQGMQALGSLLSECASQVGVFPVNWSRFIRQFPGAQKMPLLSAWISTEPSSTQKLALREQLEAAPVSERKELLTTQMRSEIAKTLGWTDIQKIGIRQPLFDLGLDSLMATELKNRLESSLGTSFSATLLFDYPTLEALVEYLVNNVIPINFSSDVDEVEETVAETVEEEIDNSSRFQGMSEDDMANLLAQQLESLGENKS